MAEMSQDATAALAAFSSGINSDKEIPVTGEDGKPIVPTMPLPATPVASNVTSKSPTLRTFYARGEASRYCFSDGGVALFQGGQFKFDPENIPEDYQPPERPNGKQDTPAEGWAKRYKELIYVCTVPNPVFSLEPVPVFKSDAHVLREVGHAGGGSVGLVGSFQVAGNLRPSNS